MTKIGIIVGMLSEARIAQRSGCAVAIGGGLPLGARRMAERLVADGATALISFGLAGGLDPALEAGVLLAPRLVISEDRSYACDETLRQQMQGEADACDSLLAGTAVVARAEEKARLWQRYRAAAIDLESGVVAEVAAERGVPFAVMRAVCDPATRNLPPAAVEALDETGRVRPMKMAGMLARHPIDILGLIALGRDAARARRALIRGAEGLGRFAARHADLGRSLRL
ncbi:phosphorylase family protein [Acidisoma sp. 7E03]